MLLVSFMRSPHSFVLETYQIFVVKLSVNDRKRSKDLLATSGKLRIASERIEITQKKLLIVICSYFMQRCESPLLLFNLILVMQSMSAPCLGKSTCFISPCRYANYLAGNEVA